MIIIDPLFESGKAWCRGVSEACHMSSDTSLEELLEFADRLDLKRQWLQRDSSVIHFDLTPGRRRKAVQMGATEVEALDFIPRCAALLTELGKKRLERRMAREAAK